MSGKTKKMFGLRTRPDDASPWSDWEWFDTRRERDKGEQLCRIIFGIRTHTCEEKRPVEKVFQ